MLRMAKITLSFSVLAVIVFALLLFPSDSFADTNYTPSKYNGVKVYLSPANHSPDKFGCDNFSESDNASDNAHEAAKDLQAMGYSVRVGSGGYEANSSSSNSWGADYHIPIHSNATSFDCEGSNSSRGGTWIMYDEGDSISYDLASKIETVMDGKSPGTNDKVLTDSAASGFNYYEFSGTYAIDAYIETAFHTYGPDKDWMLNHSTVGYYISLGIHDGIGAPNCKFDACIELTPEKASELNLMKAVDPIIERKEIGFNYKTYGGKFRELEEDIANLFMNEDSIFSSISKRSLLKGVSIDEEGIVIIDFKNFDMPAPSTYQMRQIYDELYSTIFNYPQAEEVYVQFDGSFTNWCDWLKIIQEPMTRK
ncbi:N-acetylmuramoyl-L-alanine amidase [Chengkuizengella sediminis]|uniref:N-acetylmuramoyl-L-alanine amidase n=1 Tax=Chengkuizengella sediminis TaxID=1885917 RepID=UPI001389782F|nr:N-acetylmuramoyl-L-alanine amidase [Chengkuizengella sediminis]NDI35776.1 hypothetical protein [Chengkuizengella sediminis]